MKDYAKSEREHRLAEDAPNTDALSAERAARYAALLRVERGPAAFRVTFPELSDPDDATRRAAFREARPLMAEVKSVPGRRYDAVQKAWIIPLEAEQTVELLAEQYGVTVEAAADDAAARRIAELEQQVAELEAELEAAMQHDCRAVLQAVAA